MPVPTCVIVAPRRANNMHHITLSAATAPRNAAGVRESAGIWRERWRKRGREGGRTMVRVKDLMTLQAEVISPDATAEDAASVMKTLDIGVLPVCDEEGLVGILTDRDLVVRVLAAKRDPKAMLVGEAMTPSVVYCFEDDDVERAALVMAGQQIRRLGARPQSQTGRHYFYRRYRCPGTISARR